MQGKLFRYTRTSHDTVEVNDRTIRLDEATKDIPGQRGIRRYSLSERQQSLTIEYSAISNPPDGADVASSEYPRRHNPLAAKAKYDRSFKGRRFSSWSSVNSPGFVPSRPASLPIPEHNVLEVSHNCDGEVPSSPTTTTGCFCFPGVPSALTNLPYRLGNTLPFRTLSKTNPIKEKSTVVVPSPRTSTISSATSLIPIHPSPKQPERRDGRLSKISKDATPGVLDTRSHAVLKSKDFGFPRTMSPGPMDSPPARSSVEQPQPFSLEDGPPSHIHRADSNTVKSKWGQVVSCIISIGFCSAAQNPSQYVRSRLQPQMIMS